MLNTLKNTASSLTSLTLISLLAACGGGGGSGGGGSARPMPDTRSIDSVPAEHQSKVKSKKTTIDDGKLTLTDKNDKNKIILAPDNSGDLDMSRLPNGLLEYAFDMKGAVTDAVTEQGTFKAYQQPYSITMVAYRKDGSALRSGYFETKGMETEAAKLPLKTTARYKGAAFNAWSNNGVFNYTVNFGADPAAIKGNGTVAGLKGKPGNAQYDWATLTLKENFRSSLSHPGVSLDGDVTGPNITDGNYGLGFYGPNAEELAGDGWVRIDGKTLDFGFGGKKQ